MTERYSYFHLRAISTLFGLYLFTHFVYLIYFAGELFSASGMFPAELSPAYGFFPNPFNLIDTPIFATIFLTALTGLSLLVVAGVEKKWLFLLLWFGWACLNTRNPLIRNPGMPYVGWMLLAFAVIYPIKDQARFRLYKYIFIGAWSLLAVGYSLSGFDKLNSTSWQDGTAIGHLLVNPLARDYWLTHVLVNQTWLHPILTYASLGMELLFLPLALWRKTRPWIWLGLVIIQLNILLVVDFADLTFGMLMIHLFTFDPTWIPNRIKSGAVVFFDGVCGLCNQSVDFLIQEDSNQTLQYSPLQGEAVKRHNLNIDSENMNTLFIWTGEKMLTKSEGWLWLMGQLGGIWYLVTLPCRLIPYPIMNLVYDFIARNRYRIFGKRETCRLPSPEERSLFLD